MISGAQIRAARALLGMSGTELSELAGVGWSTVQRFETTDKIPASKAGTLERIKNALEVRGVVFLGDPVNSPGVQLSPMDVTPAKSRAKR
jgi:DNA-binding Xre family transcriptional regulator